MVLITRLWRTSKTLGPRSQERQRAFCGALDSPPPTEPSLIECENIYCKSHDQPCAKRRWMETFKALKELVPSSCLISIRPKFGSGSCCPVAGSTKLM